MAKKFGKLVLFTAAVGTIAAAAYLAYKNTEEALAKLNDDDFDDFEDSGEVHVKKASGRKYVDLFNENDDEDEDVKKEDKDFVPLSETVSEAVEKAADEVEEFFDEEDTSEDDFEEDFREEPADDTPEEGSEDL
ncbi:MAG: hypothetical protein J6033_00515 [Lachnospiraceae bacterium]|nr:hypothetical protein [Lachnospiraceae bacterium]